MDPLGAHLQRDEDHSRAARGARGGQRRWRPARPARCFGGSAQSEACARDVQVIGVVADIGGGGGAAIVSLDGGHSQGDARGHMRACRRMNPALTEVRDRAVVIERIRRTPGRLRCRCSGHRRRAAWPGQRAARAACRRRRALSTPMPATPVARAAAIPAGWRQ
ncbi:hypothetical protein ACU4GD_38175 [Cupriavidus basilensis]